MTRRLGVAVFVGVLALCALAPAAAAGPARFVTIDYPGAVATFAHGINPAGDIVGGYSLSGDDEHGFLLRNGTFTSFDAPGADWTEFEGITPQGDILGEYGLADNTVHGFVLRKGVVYPVDVSQPSDVGPANTVPVHINPQGTIVGCFHQSQANGATIMNTMYGYKMTADGSLTTFSLDRSMDNGINAAGDVVGIYYPVGAGAQSYLVHDGTTTWFSFPGSIATQAWDISPTGTIVGFYRDASGFHGFLRVGDEMTSFDVPDAASTRAMGINAGGDIVGYYSDATGLHGFLRTSAQ